MNASTQGKSRFGRRTLVGLAAVGMVAVTATACTSDSDSSKPVADIPSLSGQTTAVKLDSGFTDALTSLKLTPGVVGSAKLTDGSLIFPITGGNVTYYKPGSVSPFVQGEIQHTGSGLSLSAGGTTVQLTNFVIDPGASKLYGDVAANGASVAKRAYLFNLDGTTLKALQTAGDTAILEGTKVALSPDAAALLGKTFKTTAVKGGLLVGVAKITVNTK
ncbi:MAG TPA: hypothetical protein VF612_14240 [Jatrophihabitans sp.]|jgi:hypothetical protein|uniref:hypothetical protein n=1 Tax=Jatrophihabitans sp. TaxID=1932789 RepID=UPI002EEB95D8